MEPIFRVEHFTTGYKEPVIQDASFSVCAGQLVGIIGRNGQGKTTLLRGMIGESKRFSGKIYVGNREISKISVKEQATLLSVLPQKVYVPEGVLVEELLEMGCYASKKLWSMIGEKERIRIQNAARTFGILELLDKECSKLSAGQQQMVFLCRMFIQDTPIMLLDEPNAALDFNNSYMLLNFLRKMIKEHQKAGILVIHNPEAALRWCDALVILDGGKIARKINLHQAGKEELQQALRIIYPNIRVEKNPYCEGYICYMETDLHRNI